MNSPLVDDAITLAGALAEAGVTAIELRTATSGWQALSARTTDLPGLIAAAAESAELRWPGGGASLKDAALRWWGTAAGHPLPEHPL